jgi:hypothetical protein
MSIFSRLFQKEDGSPDDTPPDGVNVGAVPVAESTSPALSQPEPAPPERITTTVKVEPSASFTKRPGAEMTAANDPGSAIPARPSATMPVAASVPVSPAAAASPPAASSSSPSSPALAAPPPVPAPRRAAQTRHKTPPPSARLGGTPDAELNETLETLFPSAGGQPGRPPRPAPARHGVSTAADQAAVRATFEDLAVAHVRPLRNMMIDLKWGEPVTVWLDLARPALRSLRQMAEQVELADLVKAIDGFSAGLDKAVQGGGGGSIEQTREPLLAAYAPLAKSMPRAFELEGERDRREPIIVQSILRQVPALEPLMVQRLYAVGLGRLDTLLRATAEEIAVVADLPAPVSAAVVAKVQELRRGADGAADVANTRRVVQPLVRSLEASQHSYEKAASGWSSDSVSAKRRHRREREVAFLQLKVALARAGEVDLVQRLETLSFARRIDELERYLREAAGAAAQA